MQPATLRLTGTILGYLGLILSVGWIAHLLWQQTGFAGGIIDLLTGVRPTTWLLIPLACLPGMLIHVAGDAVEARRKGMSIREVQFTRHLKFQAPPDSRPPKNRS